MNIAYGAAAALLTFAVACLPARSESAFSFATNSGVSSTVILNSNFDNPPMTQAMIDQVQNNGCIPRGSLYPDSGISVYWQMTGTIAPGAMFQASLAICADADAQHRHERISLDSVSSSASGSGFSKPNDVKVAMSTPSGTAIQIERIAGHDAFKKSFFRIKDSSTPDGPQSYSVLESGAYSLVVTNPGKIDDYVEFYLQLTGSLYPQ